MSIKCKCVLQVINLNAMSLLLSCNIQLNKNGIQFPWFSSVFVCFPHDRLFPSFLFPLFPFPYSLFPNSPLFSSILICFFLWYNFGKMKSIQRIRPENLNDQSIWRDQQQYRAVLKINLTSLVNILARSETYYSHAWSC